MTSANLVRVLSDLGLEKNQYYRLENLNSINLESDGNQFYNPKTHIIKFDPDNGLICLKYSLLYPRSGILNMFSYNKDLNTIYVSTPFGSVYYYKTIREPKVGDHIFSYDSRTKSYSQATIQTITRKTGVTEIKFLDSSESTLMATIAAASGAMCFFCVLQDDSQITDQVVLSTEPCVIYYSKAYSTNDSDIIISLDRVSGIELSKRWTAA